MLEPQKGQKKEIDFVCVILNKNIYISWLYYLARFSRCWRNRRENDKGAPNIGES